MYLVVLLVVYNFLMSLFGFFGVLYVGVWVVFSVGVGLDVVFLLIVCEGVICVGLVLLLVLLWV